jgi:hypothetical protein
VRPPFFGPRRNTTKAEGNYRVLFRHRESLVRWSNGIEL